MISMYHPLLFVLVWLLGVVAIVKTAPAVVARQAIRSAQPKPLSNLRLIQHGADIYVAAEIMTFLGRIAVVDKFLSVPSQSLLGPIAISGWVILWSTRWIVNMLARVGGSVVAAFFYGATRDSPSERFRAWREGFRTAYAPSVDEWLGELESCASVLHQTGNPAAVELMAGCWIQQKLHTTNHADQRG